MPVRLGVDEPTRIDHQETDPVATGFGVITPQSGQRAAEQLDEQPQRVALVSCHTAQRQDAATCRAIEPVGIGRRLPLGILHPALRKALATVPVNPDLPLGCDRRRKVGQNRIAVGRKGISDRVGRQPSLATSRRQHEVAVDRRVARGQCHQPPLGGQLHVRPQSRHVVASTGHHASGTRLGGQRDRRLDSSHGTYRTETQTTIDHRRAGRTLIDRYLGSRCDRSLGDKTEVLGQPQDSVRVVSQQAALNQVIGHDLRLPIGRTGGDQQFLRERLENRGSNNGGITHGQNRVLEEKSR